MINIEILGTGYYLPEQIVTSEQLDEKLGLEKGWVEKKSGLKERRFVTHETSAFMGAQAALDALKRANLTLDEIDCIVSACAVMQQAIPSCAVMIKEQLGYQKDIPCFDINSTCLSFLTALETMSYTLMGGKYKKVLIVTSEIASSGLNWSCLETCTIFGDGAAACVIAPTRAQHSSRILASLFENHIEGANYCVLEGLGTKVAQANHTTLNLANYQFKMNGKSVFKMARQLLPRFIDKLLAQSQLTKEKIDWIVPHQASGLALHHIEKHLGFQAHKFINRISHLGNQIAASIPTVLHLGISEQKIRRGDRILLLGTGAGFSMGGIILEY